MRLRTLKDAYLGQDIYIIGAGPSVNLFPMEFLRDKVCISLNDTYKMHPAVKPVVIMNNPAYAHAGHIEAPLHENFKNIKYPVVKMTGKHRSSKNIDWDHPHYYCYDWSHNIDTEIWAMTKDTDYLYSSPEGCILHEALQLAWILGAKNIFVIGCDSRTMGGRHYADFNKDGFSADEEPKGVYKKGRNYDSYVYGALIVREFLRKKGVNVFNLSNIIGYHMVDYQFEVLKGSRPFQEVLDEVNKLEKWEPTPGGAPQYSPDAEAMNGNAVAAPAGAPDLKPSAEHLAWYEKRQAELKGRWEKKRANERFSSLVPKPVKDRLKRLREKIENKRRAFFYKSDYSDSRARFEKEKGARDASQSYDWVYVLKKKTPDRSTEDRFAKMGNESGGRYCVHYLSASRALPGSKRYYFTDAELLMKSVRANPQLWGSEIFVEAAPPSGAHASEWEYARKELSVQVRG